MPNFIKKMPFGLIFALLIGFTTFFVLGADAPPVVVPPVTPPAPDAVPWYAFLLQYAWQGIAALLGLAMTWFFTFISGKVSANAANQAMIDTLHAAVALAEADLEVEVKADLADGKLDSTELARIRTLVMNKALSIATGPVKDSLIALGTPYIEGLIQQILNKFRGTPATPVTPAPVVIPAPSAT